MLGLNRNGILAMDEFVWSTCIITDRSPQSNHKRTYDYAYTVDGVEYTGQVTLQVKSRQRVQMHNNYHVGDTVTVWYDPAAPSVSMIRKPDPAGDSWAPVLYGFLLSAAFFLTFKWAFSDNLPDSPPGHGRSERSTTARRHIGDGKVTRRRPTAHRGTDGQSVTTPRTAAI